MDKTEFLTIFPTYGKLDIVKKTLPSIIKETKSNNAKLIVHDSTTIEHGQEEKWKYLQALNKTNDFFLILSTNISMAHARNMCLQLGQELFAPDFICMLEDDHGYSDDLILEMTKSMKQYYGKKSPNGLTYGMFTACFCHTHARLKEIDNMYSYPSPDNIPFVLGGSNSCFRCAPTSHWNNVLKGYDTDEYLISQYQTSNLNKRNYNKGFSVLYVGGGKLLFSFDEGGRGMSFDQELALYDKVFTASDMRSIYSGKSDALINNKSLDLRNKYYSDLQLSANKQTTLKNKIKIKIKSAPRND